ncbi:NADH-ubiquinone oxidoreductase chain 2 (mitochondrion) [[Candida] anglica]
MTSIAFLSLLVYSTYSTPIMTNRLTLLIMLFVLIIFNSSFNLISLNNGLALFNDWFIMYNNNYYFITVITSLIIFLLSYNCFSFSNSKIEANIYFSLIILANSIALLLFPLVNDLLSLYILIELQSYSLYILTGMTNKSYNSSRAALLYFLMGGIASCLILLSSYFMYLDTGTTNLSEMWSMSYYTDLTMFNYILILALMFKMGMAPLHRWSIAVYNYAPTYMTAYMSIVAKVSIISFILTWAATLDLSIIYMFFISSLIIGCYKPLYQINIKIILAYSGLLNFSYLLLSLIINNEVSLVGFYLYLSQYILTHMLMFIIMLTMSYYMTSPPTIWSPITFMHQLNMPNKALSGCLIMALFSLIGLPPTPGFYAKLLMFTSALSSNYMFESLLMVMCSVIATYFYANMIKVLMMNTESTNNNNMSPVMAYMMSFSSMLLMFIWVYLDIMLQGMYMLIM